MAASIVQLFVEAPSLELLADCRKADLQALAEHCGIQISKSRVKAMLKSTVAEQLAERGILSAATSAPLSDSDRPVEREEEAGNLGEEQRGGTKATPKAEADGVVLGTPQVPRTLPRFDPDTLSLSQSPGSDTDARVRVRMAPLEIERQERERDRVRQSDAHCRIEIRKL